MAKQQEDAFDVLTFYIYVMALLTAIVGGFALWNKKKVDGEVSKIRGEIDRLDRMRTMASNEDLRGWIGRERQTRTQNVGGEYSGNDFQQLYTACVKSCGLNMTNSSSLGTRDLPGGTELTYRVQLDGCRVENLVRFLVQVEEQWPGARTKLIQKLDWNENKKSWDAIVELSIFRAES